MIQDVWREKLMEAANAASTSGLINMSELARRVGWTQPQIVKFCQNGTGNAEKLSVLERELRSLGFFVDPFRDIARGLNATADFLVSGASEDQKREKLQVLIDSLAAGKIEAMQSERH